MSTPEQPTASIRPQSPLSVHCGRCGAKPGQACRFPGNDGEYHGERLAIVGLGECPQCGVATGHSCLSAWGRPVRPHKCRKEQEIDDI